jgi:hypothetical protein
LVPRAAIGFVRNLGNNQPEFIPGLRITPPTTGDDQGFYVLTLPKSRLIEQLAITVDSVSGTNYNPAVIAKVVTSADMTIYPGALKPNDQFSVQAYNAQLSTYQSIHSQLIDQFGEPERARIQQILRNQFGQQLLDMARAETEGRLRGFSQEQLATSRTLLKKVLVMYGLANEEPVAEPLPCLIPYRHIYCTPQYSRGLFGHCKRR